MADRYFIRSHHMAVDSTASANARVDFELIGEGETSVEEIRDDPAISPYSIDLEKKRVEFVEIPPRTDLRREPFLYQAQRNHAVTVHSVSFGEFDEMTEALPLPSESLVPVYSVGRCGSTLLHRVLGECSKVRAISEPDMFQVLLEAPDSVSPDRRRRLMRGIMKLLWLKFGREGTQLVLKFRSELCELWAAFDEALGSPRAVFLYRDPEETVQSWDRVFGKSKHGRRQWMLRVPVVSQGLRAVLAASARRKAEMLEKYAPLLTGCTPTDVMLDVGWAGRHLLRWLGKVAAYRAAQARGTDVVALRYEDMTQRELGTFGRLFEHLGLPADEVSRCCTAMQRDSQAGTFLARQEPARPLDPRTREAIRRVVVQHAGLGAPPIILEGTLRPEDGAT